MADEVAGMRVLFDAAMPRGQAFALPGDVASALREHGWQPQEVAGLFTGLWRHPWKANSCELSTPQALAADATEGDEPPLWAVIRL